MRDLLAFLRRAFSRFRDNHGLLLAGAVAYYTLLSIVPLFALLLVGLSHVVPEARLLDALDEVLEMVAPGTSISLEEQLRAFLDHRQVIGVFGFLVLLFFSAMAFTVLEDAMEAIFHHRRRDLRRPTWKRLALPYVFVAFVGLGLLLMTLISGALRVLAERDVTLFGETFSLSGPSAAALYALGLSGLVLLLTALYLVLPMGKVPLRHAALGGLTTTLLWEISRHVLVWYFSTLSLVHVVYGPFASTIVLLVSFEVGSILLLFGAQVIAEVERRGDPESRATLAPRHTEVPGAAVPLEE